MTRVGTTQVTRVKRSKIRSKSVRPSPTDQTNVYYATRPQLLSFEVANSALQLKISESMRSPCTTVSDINQIKNVRPKSLKYGVASFRPNNVTQISFSSNKPLSSHQQADSYEGSNLPRLQSSSDENHDVKVPKMISFQNKSAQDTNSWIPEVTQQMKEKDKKRNPTPSKSATKGDKNLSNATNSTSISANTTNSMANTTIGAFGNNTGSSSVATGSTIITTMSTNVNITSSISTTVGSTNTTSSTNGTSNNSMTTTTTETTSTDTSVTGSGLYVTTTVGITNNSTNGTNATANTNATTSMNSTSSTVAASSPTTLATTMSATSIVTSSTAVTTQTTTITTTTTTTIKTTTSSSATTVTTTTTSGFNNTFNINLVSNGDGETGSCASGNTVVSPTGWNHNGSITQVYYSNTAYGDQTPTSPGPSDRGQCYFFGQISTSTTMWQQINLTATVDPTLIDASSVNFNLSAWLGGWSSENDNAQVSVIFKNQLNQQVGSTTTIGPVTAAQRGSTTSLLFRQAQNVVPAGARSVVVFVTITKAAGTWNDGDVDNIRFVMYP